MKQHLLTKRHLRGFTLVELGVVLAIIGILAAIAVPSVSYFLRQGRVKNMAGSVNNLRNWVGALQASGAVAGGVPITEGTRPTVTGTALAAQSATDVAAAARLDQVLVSAGITDRLLQFSMGAKATVNPQADDLRWSAARRAFFIPDEQGNVSQAGTTTRDWSGVSRLESRLSTPTQSPLDAEGGNFRLDGINNLPPNTVVAYLSLHAVPFRDAVELARSLNADQLSAGVEDGTADQVAGPVVFRRPAGGDASVDVKVFVAAL